MIDSDAITLRAMTERLQAGPWMALKSPQRLFAKALQIQQAFGPDDPIIDISQQAVSEYIQSLRESYAPSTVNRTLDVLRQLFAEAASLLPDADLPIVGRIYEPPQTKVRTLSEDEQCRLALTAEFLYGFKWQLFLTVLLDQALRKSEAMTLVWDDINFPAKTVTIWRTKTRRPRTLPLSDRVYRKLQTLKLKSPLPVRGKEPVFGYSASQIERRWRKTRKYASLKGVVTHSLRHTAASNLSAAGCPLNILQEYLGHSSITTTLRYAHVDTKALSLARDLIDNINAKDRAGKPEKRPMIL